MLRVVLDASPVEAYQNDTGKVGTPSALIDDLTLALTRAIEELTRPIDAIKHQAKTVTVGISRSEEGLFDRALVKAVVDAGAAREQLSYATLKVLAALDAAVDSVVGYTRYAISGDPTLNLATISIVERGGLALQRHLDAWVRTPRGLTLTLSLVDTRRGDAVVAERVITVEQGVGIRGRAAITTGDAWYTQLSTTIGAASQEVLKPLACETPWLDVVMEQGKFRLSTRGMTGLDNGRAVLLIPPVESSARARWPIAKVRSTSRVDSVELELISGSATGCEAGCKALVL
jgi:hypothetical protein